MGRKSSYRYFKIQTGDIDNEITWASLRRGNLKRETKSVLIVAENNAVRASCIKENCRLCRDRNEKVNHSISKCSKLSKK